MCHEFHPVEGMEFIVKSVITHSYSLLSLYHKGIILSVYEVFRFSLCWILTCGLIVAPFSCVDTIIILAYMSHYVSPSKSYPCGLLLIIFQQMDETKENLQMYWVSPC